MNLLLINYEYPPIGGGAANATWNIAKALNELGHQVTVLTAAYKDLIGWRNENGVNVFRCLAVRNHRATSTILEMLTFVVSAAIILPRIAKKRNIAGIVVFFLFPCGPLGLITHFLFRIPYLISLRGGDVPETEPGLMWIHRLLKPIRRLVYRKSAAIIANSIGLKKIAQRTDVIDIQVIPNGVDTDFFQPKQPSKAVSGSAFKLLYVGRFQPEKNLPYLFHCLSDLVNKSETPFMIHMVGEGPQKKELEALGKKLKLTDRIIWHGWLDSISLRERYRSADCLVMPSRYEGMSNVILEAMACGLPVLASRVGGNVDLIQNGQTGLFFDIESAESFQQSFMELVGNYERTFELGRNERRFFKKSMSWQQVAFQYQSQFIF